MAMIFKSIENLSEWSGRICSWLVYIGIFMLSFEVVSRYVFNAPTVWAHGYTQRFFGSYYVLVGAYAFIHDGHVRIDVLYSRFSEKARAALDCINCLFLIVWGVLVMKAGWTFFMRSFNIREVDEMVLSHPIYPVKFLLVVGMGLIVLQGISTLILKIHFLINGKEPI